MKFKFLSLALFFSFWGWGCEQPASLQMNREWAIKQVLSDQVNEWNRGSVDGFMKGYWNSDSLQFITPNGVKKGYNTVLKSYKKNYPTSLEMGTLHFEILHVKFLSDDNSSAQVLGKWHVTENPKPGSGYFSLIFRFFEDGPKIIIDHTY
jgi:hypothetical protein